jgi:hypothetical protein
MKRPFVVLVLVLFLLSACSLPGRPRPATGLASTSPVQTPIQPTPSESPARRAPLFMTTMTHMEQSFTDDRDQAIFLRHIEQLSYGLDLADEYGARLTIESEKPFAIANTTWGRNFMAEIVARGHGVGTHCDFGFRSELMSVEQYSRFFAENKAVVDALVGAENNLGCSGGGGANDWAQAAARAGFKYLDGVVGMHYLSMPLENRPDPTWTDNFIRETAYHYGAPYDLSQRIYPFLVSDATDFVPDADGNLLVSSGELGALSMIAEGTYRDAPLTNEDVDTLLTLIRQVDHDRDRSRIAKLTVYLPANIFEAENETVLRYFFQQLQGLSEQGLITWATQLQVYEAYMDWNK